MSGGDRGHPQHAETAYHRVRLAILDGDLAPGHKLSQVTMADAFGTSRTPLREALRILQGEGLLESAPHRQMRVAPLSPDDLEQLYILRVTLETEALRLSIPHMASQQLANLEGHLAEMAHFEQTRDYGRWTAAHAGLHRSLTAPAGKRVNRLLEELSDHAGRYRRLLIGLAPAAWEAGSHRQILEACKAHRREHAASLLANHLARTGLQAIRLLDRDYEAAALAAAVTDVSTTAA
jgi:DNA-binding GntR family transcriptional regulator